MCLSAACFSLFPAPTTTAAAINPLWIYLERAESRENFFFAALFFSSPFSALRVHKSACTFIHWIMFLLFLCDCQACTYTCHAVCFGNPKTPPPHNAWRALRTLRKWSVDNKSKNWGRKAFGFCCCWNTADALVLTHSVAANTEK